MTLLLVGPKNTDMSLLLCIFRVLASTISHSTSFLPLPQPPHFYSFFCPNDLSFLGTKHGQLIVIGVGIFLELRVGLHQNCLGNMLVDLL